MVMASRENYRASDFSRSCISGTWSALFALEEIDGFMESVSRLNPELTDQVAILKREHEQFRAVVRKMVVRIDLASPLKLHEFEVTCAELRHTINHVLEHLRREQELLVESFCRDTGGEA